MARSWHGHAAHATMAPCTVTGHAEEHWPFSVLVPQVTLMVNVCICFKITGRRKLDNTLTAAWRWVLQLEEKFCGSPKRQCRWVLCLSMPIGVGFAPINAHWDGVCVNLPIGMGFVPINAHWGWGLCPLMSIWEGMVVPVNRWNLHWLESLSRRRLLYLKFRRNKFYFRNLWWTACIEFSEPFFSAAWFLGLLESTSYAWTCSVCDAQILFCSIIPNNCRGRRKSFITRSGALREPRRTVKTGLKTASIHGQCSRVL